MKYRDHRGGLKESMETVREIEPTLDALAVVLKVPPSAITVETYGYDERIDWHTFLVANRVVRTHAIGNGQLPSVAAGAWRVLTQASPSSDGVKP